MEQSESPLLGKQGHGLFQHRAVFQTLILLALAEVGIVAALFSGLVLVDRSLQTASYGFPLPWKNYFNAYGSISLEAFVADVLFYMSVAYVALSCFAQARKRSARSPLVLPLAAAYVAGLAGLISLEAWANSLPFDYMDPVVGVVVILLLLVLSVVLLGWTFIELLVSRLTGPKPEHS